VKGAGVKAEERRNEESMEAQSRTVGGGWVKHGGLKWATCGGMKGRSVGDGVKDDG
jgi:hypothetical protein